MFPAGTIVTIYTIGCLIGGLKITQVRNCSSCCRSLIFAAVVAVIGLIVQATSYSLGQLIVGHTVSGIGNRGVNSIIPVWQSECTKPKSSSKNVIIINIFIASRITSAGWVDISLIFVEYDKIAWHLSLALLIFFALILIAFPMSFPGLPHWLVSQSRQEEACRRSL